MLSILFTSFIFYLCVAGESSNKSEKAVHPALRHNTQPVSIGDLLLDYDKTLPPILADSPVIVRTQVRIDYASWNDDILTLKFTLREFWTDPRLVYTASDPTSSILIMNHIASIWTPDTFISVALSLTPLHVGALRLRPSGRVARSRPMIITQQCARNSSDVANAHCYLKVDSYAETSDRVAYVWLGKDEQEEGVRMGDDPVRLTGNVKETIVAVEPSINLGNSTMGSYQTAEVRLHVHTGLSQNLIDYLLKKKSKDL